METTPADTLDYRSAGVDISAGNLAVQLIKEEVAGTFDGNVLTGLGDFASMYDLRQIVERYRHPVLMQSVDGVGTKISIARMTNDYSSIGRDLVSACANDIVVHGAKPLTFLDYIANDRLDPLTTAVIVRGIAAACRETHVCLVGGETAEMPGVYLPGEHDLVGLVTGVAEREAIVDGHTVVSGDVILAVGSSGLHTNGYSLARKVLFEHAGLQADDPLPSESDTTVGKALLIPHANYTNGVRDLLASGAPVRSMAHITGGGLIENVPRVIPKGLSPRFFPDRWSRHSLFDLIGQLGGVSGREMFRTFNMGIGLTVVVPRSEAEATLRTMRICFAQPVWEVGDIVPGDGSTWIGGVSE